MAREGMKTDESLGVEKISKPVPIVPEVAKVPTAENKKDEVEKNGK